MDFKNPASLVLWYFLGTLDRIYGLHSDVGFGLKMYGERIQQLITDKIAEPDKRMFMFGDGDPNRDEATYTHSVRVADLVDRNKPDGENQAILSQAIIVFVYTIWDSSVRPLYAKTLGVEAKTITSDLMGDLRHYRNSILHGIGLLKNDTKVLHFIPKGAPISLSSNQMNELFKMLFQEMSDVNFRHAGEPLKLNFERRLNAKGEFPASDDASKTSK